MKNQQYLMAVVALIFTPLSQPEALADDDGITIGAIRWNAHVGNLGYDTGFKSGIWEEQALSPAKFHHRLPFYAEITGRDSVEVRFQSQGVYNRVAPVGGWEDQEIMDMEIEAAAGSLDYWAFLDYPDSKKNGEMHTHLALYLASSKKSLINFAIILTRESEWWVTGGRDAVYLSYLREASYQRVVVNNESRPLVFLFQPRADMLSTTNSWAPFQAKLVEFTSKSVAQGTGVPYYVCMGTFAEMNLAVAALSDSNTHGTPAISQYYGTSYHNSAEHLGTGKQLVPCMNVGWDGRPRKEASDASNGSVGNGAWTGYTVRSHKRSPESVAEDVKSVLVDWIKANTLNATNNQCESRTGLIYAWNEFSEGGWLCPTLYDGDDRLRALRRMRTIRADYRLDGNATDVSGANATLTTVGAASYVAGRNGPSLSLNAAAATPGHAHAPDSPTFDKDLQQMTLSCWVWLESFPAAGSFVCPVGKEGSYRIMVGSNGGAHFAVRTANNAWYSPGTTVGMGTLSQGQWQHLVATYDGKHLRTYLNGNQIATTTNQISGPIVDGAAAFRLGCINGVAPFMNGRVDEVTLWKTALSNQEVIDLYHAGLVVGDWPLNEFDEYFQGSYTNYPRFCYDASRSENRATPYNGVTQVLDHAARYGQAVSFQATHSQYMEVLNSPVLNGMDQLTVVCWVKPSSWPSANSHVFPLAKEGAYRFVIGPNGQLSAAIATTNNGWYTSGTVAQGGALALNKWQHLALVYNGSTLSVYVDGVLKAQNPQLPSIGGSIVTNANPLCFGARKVLSGVPAGHFDGAIDAVTIFSAALSEAEIDELIAFQDNTLINGQVQSQ